MMDLADGDDEEQGGIADGSSAATYKIFQAAGELTIRRGLHLSPGMFDAAFLFRF
jgi:hypothetical protein